MAIAMQRMTQSKARVLRHIVQSHGEEIAKSSARSLLVFPVLQSMANARNNTIPLNGQPVKRQLDGRDWNIRVQDASSVPGLFNSSAEVIRLFLPELSEAQLLSLQALLPKQRLTLRQGLTTSGLSVNSIDKMRVVRQATNPRLNIANVPVELVSDVRRLPRSRLQKSNAREVSISIDPASGQ